MNNNNNVAPNHYKGIVLALVLMLTSTGAMAINKSPRIIGGSDAEPEQFPWQAALLSDSSDPSGSQECGASILTDRWILTAAHCYSEELQYVMVGTHDLEDTEEAEIIEIEDWYVHPGFVDEESAESGDIILDYDIALIKLSTPIDFDACGSRCQTISPVTSENESSVMALSTPAYVSGWGDTNPAEASELDVYYPPILQWIEVNIVRCTDSLSGYTSADVSKRMFCASVSDFSKDSCQGDSGGPLVVRNESGTGYLQAGIVSWGEGCAIPDYPGVYTRLSKFQDWIWETTEGECCEAPSESSETSNKSGGSLPWLILLAMPLLSVRKYITHPVRS